MNRRGFFLAALLIMVFGASATSACPVCFGDIEHPVIDGLELSILFMLGVTYFVILSGIAAFILLRRRARRLALASQTPETVQGAQP